jgi:hypothetical protein
MHKHVLNYVSSFFSTSSTVYQKLIVGGNVNPKGPDFVITKLPINAMHSL